MENLSVIIPVLNDESELIETILSIRGTSPESVEIVVVDDGSDVPVKLADKNATLIRFSKRVGAGISRSVGVLNCHSDSIFLCDSHMRFVRGWHEAVMERLREAPTTIWCGSCLALSEGSMNPDKHSGAYYGADLCFHNPNSGHIFEGIWRPEVANQDDYEIPCLMGACYFMRKEWFLHIGGLCGNKFWGSEEPFLSLKSWLAGGEVRLAKTVRVGHKFRDTAPYSTDIRYPAYNKLRSMMVTLPERHRNRLISFMPEAAAAMPLIQRDLVEIEAEQQYYRSVAKRDIGWFCEKFEINTFN